VAEEFGLHELAVEDSVKAHQRPKLERYDGTLFLELKSARYLEKTNEVEFSEAHVFVGENFVVTVRHGEVPAFSAVRERLEDEPGLLSRGPWGRPARHHGRGCRRLRSGGGRARRRHRGGRSRGLRGQR
jgi:magnesium transporter